MIRAFVVAAVAALCATALLPSAAAAARPVRAEDLYKINFIGAVQISPDGKSVAYVVSRMNGPADKYYTNLWLADVATGRTREITTSNGDDGPAWSPDSRHIAFVRALPKKRPQIYVYDIGTGRARQLTKLKTGAGDPLYSNNGKRIAFDSNTVDEQPKAQIDFAAAGFKPKKEQLKSDIRQITTLHYRDNGAGETYMYHRHIWVMNADGSAQQALTSGHEWSEGNFSWSPDDKTIAFNTIRRTTPDAGPDDIYTISSSGGPMHKMAETDIANDGPTYGHSNSRLWYFTAKSDQDPAQYEAFVSSRPDGSDRRVIYGENKVALGDALLGDMKEGGGACGNLPPDDRFFLTIVSVPGASEVVKISTADGTITPLTGSDGEAFNCSLSADGKTVAYARSDFTHPGDVYVTTTSNSHPRRLVALNDALLSTLTLSKPQPFVVKDSDGMDVHAWFMPAVTGSGKRPTLLNIHGGPETEFGNNFFHELQLWAAMGYNVVFSDPRGSVGFGYPFEEALAKNFGDAMFDDVQAVMDEAIKRPTVDVNRLGVMGGSYGGYATLWVISHTDRYKTAIAERVVSNLMSQFTVADYASQNGLGGEYAWGLPWKPGNTYLAQSPVTYVDKVHTPLLILHSTEDTRTPEDQTLQEYSSLKMLGRTVKFVEVPGENHDLSRTGAPLHRVERLHIMGDWLNQYLRP